MKTFSTYEKNAINRLNTQLANCDCRGFKHDRNHTLHAFIIEQIKRDAKTENIPWLQEKALLDKSFCKYCR